MLDALEDTPWVSPSDLSTAAKATAGSLTWRRPTTATRLDRLLRTLVDSERELVAFASAVDDPATVTAPARLQLLALASNAGGTNPTPSPPPSTGRPGPGRRPTTR